MRATDYAGNTDQTPATRAFRVDTAAPVTDDDVPDSVQSAPVEVTLTASDVDGSGVDKTYYTTGTSPAEPTTSSSVYSDAAKPTLQDGEQIRYFSTDNAGNSDTPQSSPAAQVDADGDGTRDADDAFPDDPAETSDCDGDGIGDNADDFPGHAPAAVDDSETLAEDSVAASIDVLGNDTDVDGGPKTIASATQPSNGSVVVADDDASLSYKPDAGYCNSQSGGASDSFMYTLGGGSQATVAVTVTCGATPLGRAVHAGALRRA